MSVDIPSDYFPLVQQLISQGRFRDEGEVVAEGLRLVSVKERLRADVAAGLAELDAGERVSAVDAYQAAREAVKNVERQQTQ